MLESVSMAKWKWGNVQHPTSNIEHPIERCAWHHWMLVVRCWMLDVDSVSCFLLSSQINLHDLLAVLHFVHRTFAQHRALMQHGDFAGELPDERHIMLDDGDAVLAFETHQYFAGLVRFLVGHAGGGFVDEQQLRILREQHADFEPLLLPVA